MTRQELKNKVADPDGAFRKWGTFFTPIIVGLAGFIYTQVQNPATKESQVKGEERLIRIESKLDNIVSNRYEDLTRQQRTDQAQWNAISKINDRMFTQNKTVKP